MNQPCLCGGHDALCHPYFTCTRCGLDFDDETFYKRTQHRRGDGVHANRHRHRVHDTICKACRQQERDDLKGPAPILDWAAIPRHRFVLKARRTLGHHAHRFPDRSVHDFEKAGITETWLADRFATTTLCEYCDGPFHALDDQTLDLMVPKQPLSVLLMRIACSTCNTAKAEFESAPNAVQLITRWTLNYRRWRRHRDLCRARARIEPITPNDTGIGFQDGTGVGWLFDPGPAAPPDQDALFRRAGIGDLVTSPIPPIKPSKPKPSSALVPSPQQQIWTCGRCGYVALGAPLERCDRCGWQDTSC